MAKSPQRLLAISYITCVLLGLTLDLIGQNLYRYSASFSLQFPTDSEHGLSLARYYWKIGDFNKAITEYQRAIPLLSKGNLDSANREFEALLLFEKSSQGKIIGDITYYSWLLPAKLYISAFFFFLASIFLFIYRRTKKTPKFIIQNLYNYTDLNINDNLPQIAIDRIHEISWGAQNLEGISDLIADQVEIPTLSLMSEGDNQSAVELLEIALMFSTGSSNLPFANIINTIKLWLEQPDFLVRSIIDKGENTINLKISLLDRRNNTIEKIWHIKMPSKKDFPVSVVVDALIYPLLFYFNTVSATRWESLQALHVGLEEFHLFKENQSAINHLQLARQQFERALILDPEYGIAKFNLSLLLLTAGEFEKARDYLKELSTHENAQLRQKANYHRGVALFLMSQDWAYEQSIKVFKELLSKNDNNNENLSLLAQSSLAMTYAKTSERNHKERKKLVNQSLAEADKVLEKINFLKKRNKGFGQTRIFKEIAANALAAKGYACISSKEFEHAIEYFKQAIALHSGNVSSLLGLGESYLHKGLKEEALGIFKKAAIQSPLSGYINYRLGNLYYKELKDRDGSITVLKRAPHHARARLTLGKIYLDDEDFGKALDEFREASRINNQLSEAWDNIAWTISEIGENKDLLKEAEDAARRSLQLEKNEAQKWHCHAMLSLILIKEDKANKAVLEAAKAVNLAPNQAQAYYYLALSQSKVGQYPKARLSAQKVIDLDKNERWTAKAVNLLTELPKDSPQS